MYPFIFIDDEDLMREFFSEVVEFSDYGFELAGMFSKAEAALEYLKEHPEIRAVITDIRMGTMSGIEFCEKVREMNGELLLVVLSGYREFEYAQRALRCNVFDYLLKPTLFEDIDMLFKRMKKQLDQREQKGAGVHVAPVLDYQYESILERIQKYIDENFDRDISLDSVAQYAAMNPSYLSRFFKQHMQCNFLDYVSRVRVEKAIAFLADPTVKVGDVCEMVGYRTAQHFYKIFKQYTGCTPSEYRVNVLGKKE